MARLKIQQVAESKGLSITDLMRRANIGYSTAHRLWRNPDSDVSFRTLEKIAAALEVNVTDLIDNETTKRPKVSGVACA